ncbi:hypothetical protein CSE16_07140 [Solibacillus sp. R5-41]|nr:hypothetical protein CSE16_07140 [Solibacillus sp. R5-41]
MFFRCMGNLARPCFQGNGLGLYFLHTLVEFILEISPNQPIILSIFEQNKVASQLYLKFGFSFTEKFD